MAELVDAGDLKSPDLWSCGFDSRSRHPHFLPVIYMDRIRPQGDEPRVFLWMLRRRGNFKACLIFSGRAYLFDVGDKVKTSASGREK